ncbi:DUF192 domain-containing protein [Candidatus Uhrbacteria bacterium]|nr:DUF192 domain-containing protein [Candidatus Uhrbacteria bacterium]
MKLKLAYILLALMAVTFLYLRIRAVPEKAVKSVRIGNTKILVDVAVTPEARAQGLSGRAELGENEGMLFPMGESQVYAFWMKDMRFPLDIIWIRDGRVADISENIPPPKSGEFPVSVRPREPINYVLEVNAGFVEKKGINIGDPVRL